MLRKSKLEMLIELHTLACPHHSCRVNVGSGDVWFLLYLNDSWLEQTHVLTERSWLVLEVDDAEL